MGLNDFVNDLLGGGEETTTQQIEDIVSISKIVKLSYLQSLAIYAGVVTAKEFTEGESSKSKINQTLEDENDAKELANKLTSGGWVDKLLGSSGSLTGGLIDYLFGKSSKTDVNLEVIDSGWSLIKTWNEPQFDIIRYAIGIRDIILTQFTYKVVSEIITTSWTSPKEIQKINLIVDQFIPSEFPISGNYIEYYIKPDIKETEWTRINPLDLVSQYDSTGKIIPRIITYNTERPVNSNLEESYITTKEPVKSIKLRIVLKRPSGTLPNGIDPASYTPMVRSYRLLITPRGGL